MIFSPRPYQREAAAFMASHPFCALLADPGTGKTAITLAVMRWLKRREASHRTLIVAPKRVMLEVWPAEIKKWDQFNGLTYSILHGAKKERALLEATDIHLLNFEGLPWAERNKALDGYDMLVVDESTKLKNWTAQRTQILKRHLTSFKRRYILTGSPMPRSLLDYFSQQYIVDRGASLGGAITPFRHEWFNNISRDSKYAIWVPRRGALKHVLEQIKPYAFRLDGEKLLNLPSVQINDIWMTLGPRDIYDRLAFNAASKGAESMLTRQLASGYLADGTEFHSQKMDALVDLIESLQGKPVLVFFNFRAEGEAIARKFDCPLVYGGVSDSKVSHILADWNKGGLPVVALNPSTTGHGLNLQDGGHHIAWFSLPTNQDDYFQAIRRLRRQGQKAATVFVHRLLMRGTVDERLVELLDTKTEAQERFLEGVE